MGLSVGVLDAVSSIGAVSESFELMDGMMYKQLEGLLITMKISFSKNRYTNVKKMKVLHSPVSHNCCLKLVSNKNSLKSKRNHSGYPNTELVQYLNGKNVSGCRMFSPIGQGLILSTKIFSEF